MKMEEINVLPPEIFNLLAAGEVVENPASIVKEAVENSIDAGAKSIEIEIRQGGIDEIRVTDDGSGVSFDQIGRVFLPHATSKISCASDLDGIGTLGFRGEALSSIASVSVAEFTSRTHDADIAGMVKSDGSVVHVGANRGTRLVIKNLFYNTPARKKFLSAVRVEQNNVTGVVQRFVLACPSIAFRYIVDGEVALDFPGGSLRDAIEVVFGKLDLIEVVTSEGERFGQETFCGKLSGFISGPGEFRKNKSRQVVMVNGRVVDGGVIADAVNDAYSNYLMVGTFPVFVLNMEVDLSVVDVNVHPRKAQVKFSGEREIYSFVRRVVSDCIDGFFQSDKNVVAGFNLHLGEDEFGAGFMIDGGDEFGVGFMASGDDEFSDGLMAGGEGEFGAGPVADGEGGDKDGLVTGGENEDEARLVVGDEGEEKDGGELLGGGGEDGEQLSEGDVALADGVVSADHGGEKKKIEVGSSDSCAGDVKSVKKDDRAGIATVGVGLKDISFKNHGRAATARSAPNVLSLVELAHEQRIARACMKQVEVEAPAGVLFDASIIGTIFDTYILVLSRDVFYIIDQHAAHERLLFDELSAQIDAGEVVTQFLVEPSVFMLSPEEMNRVEEALPYLNRMGIHCDVFGSDCFRVSAVPVAISQRGIDTVISNVLSDVRRTPPERLSEVLKEKIISESCKAAIKAGKHLSDAQVAAFLAQFKSRAMVPLCPHGRPILVAFSKAQVEKLFKR